MKCLNLVYILSFVLIALLVNMPSSASSQTPAGFLGKRQILELDIAYNPLAGIFSDDLQYDFTTPVGVGATYRYVITDRTSIGLAGMYHNFGTPVIDGVEQEHASTEFAALVELQVGGSSTIRNPAPLGGAMIYGLGVVRYSGVERFNRSTSAQRDPEEKISVLTPMIRLGYSYRYIFKDRFSITPWSRLDASLNSTGITDTVSEQGDDSPQPLLTEVSYLLWRTGVSFGILF